MHATVEQMVEMGFLEQMIGNGIFGVSGAFRGRASVIDGFGANEKLRCK